MSACLVQCRLAPAAASVVFTAATLAVLLAMFALRLSSALAAHALGFDPA